MTRVAVFIDWQNTYKTARDAFGWRDFPNEFGNYSPLSVSRDLARANGRDENGDLVRVFVYRGLPSNRRDPAGYAANRRQSAAWMAESPEIVIPKLLDLRYDPLPREKGVDVLLAIDAVEWSLTRRCDVAVIFSHDTDLQPAVDAILRLRGAACVETASWSSDGYRSRLRQRAGVFHHHIDSDGFARCERRVNYAREG